MDVGWTKVEGIADAGQLTTVYNLEVEDDHTYYFVGGTDWSWAVWAHNEHCISVTIRDSSGKLLQSIRKFVSGGYTLAKGQINSWKLQGYSHTEAKLARSLNKFLKKGDKVVVRGQLPPCDTYAWGCQRIMRELAKKTGAIVKYTWRENGIAKSMVFKRLNNGMVEVREFSGGILVNSRSWQSTPLGAGFWLRR